jgi:release factor glutamine methyltransferase
LTRPATDWVVGTLRRAGCVFAEDEASLLIGASDTADELAARVADRVAGRPLEQILGWAEFDGRRVGVEPGVFVPRRRTELVVRVAVDGLRPGDVVVDLCCGSGAIGLALASRIAGLELHAADVDPVAVACARRNLAGLGTVHEGDLYAALPPELAGRVARLAVNAPYVPSDAIALMPPEAREHEHLIALDGGADGLDLARRVAGEAGRWIASGGRLTIETSRAQAAQLRDLMAAAGLDAAVGRDDELDATVVTGARA